MGNIEYHIEESGIKLAAAKSLFENGFYKDSASRSYYSMYHAARALLATKDIFPKTHGGMIAKFGLEFVKKDLIEKSYSRALAKGKDVREIADYDVVVEITEEEAKSVMEDAEKFLERIKEAIQEIGVQSSEGSILRCEK